MSEQMSMFAPPTTEPETPTGIGPEIPLLIAPSQSWEDAPRTYAVTQASPPLDHLQGQCGTVIQTMGDLYQLDIDGKAYWFPLAHLRHEDEPHEDEPTGVLDPSYKQGDRVYLQTKDGKQIGTITGHTTGEIAQFYPYYVCRDGHEVAYPASLEQLSLVQDIQANDKFEVISGLGYLGAIATAKRLETRLNKLCIIAEINGIEYPFIPANLQRL